MCWGMWHMGQHPWSLKVLVTNGGPGYHFAWLTQDMLPLGAPCLAQISEADHSNILRHVMQKPIHYAPAPQIISQHFSIMRLKGLLWVIPIGINICIATVRVQVRRWYSTCTQDSQELGARPFLSVCRAELKGKRALVLKIQLIP